MLVILCSKCGKDISDFHYAILLRDFKRAGITDGLRARAISNEIRDGFPPKGERPASEDEIDCIRQLGHELVALMLYEPSLCEECLKAYLYVWDPKSGQPCPFELTPELTQRERRALFRILNGGKKEDDQEN